MARSSQKSADPIAILAAQVAALSEQLAALQGASVPATPAKESRTRKPSAAKSKKSAKVYTWKPWACAKFGIPSTVGMTFAYNGKNGTSDHRVIAVSPDGIVSSVRA